jgi:hypothetical protein
MRQMPGWLTEVLKLLGFTTPFVYAAATYGVFRYLDRRASGAAKAAVSGWLQSAPTNTDDLGNALLEMFNRIYTSRLLSVRAFGRSAFFTFLISAVLIYEMSPTESVLLELRFSQYVIVTTLVANILSDYVSLFVVKSTLAHGKRTPVIALVRGVTAGMGVVVGFAIIQNMVVAAVEMSSVDYVSTSRRFIDETFSQLMATFYGPVWLALFLASLVVHLWLPLFLLAAWALRGTEYLKLAIGWTQWFIRQGRHHPFEAIGYVASAIVFVSTAAIQYVWR